MKFISPFCCRQGGLLKWILLLSVWCCPGVSVYAAPPVNDDCTAASVITIPNGGFGLGTFTSVQTDLTSAAVQTGETFAPAIFVAGLDKKSVWFKFSIATIRAVRVTLTQPGTTITAGDAGFAVYKTSSCLPGNADISSKLTPIVTFGNTYHPCVPTGEYYVQVSSNFNANGPITVQVEVSDQTGAAYDHPNQAYAFGTVGYYAHKIDFNTECQSIEDATEICNAFADPYDYNKSAWLTFKTPSYFDYLVLQLSGTGSTTYFPSNNNQPTLRKFGFTLYKGDAVTTPIGSLVTIDGCDSLETNGYYAAYKMFKCSDLDTGTVYSIQFFIQRDFADDVRWGILVGGQGPTRAPKPILSQVPAPNAIGVLPSSPGGTVTTVNDVWGCNSRHNTSNCSPALPDTGIMYNGGRYNLSSFFTFTLNNTCAINFNGTVTQCGPQPLVRVFKQGLTNSCNDLDTSNIIGVLHSSGTIDCMPPGDYTVQVSGQDPTDWYARFTYGTANTNYEQCLSNNLGTGLSLYLNAYTRKPANYYSLNATGVFDSINRVGAVMQPMADGVNYSSSADTMGCANTVLPADTSCNPNNGKAIYREFVVNDSGVVSFSNLTMPWNNSWRYKVYAGDANALATAQNVFSFPDKINGLIAKSECFDGYVSCANKSVCVIPGTYTFTTFGGDPDVGRPDHPTLTFTRTRTLHNSPLNAQDLGSIMDTLGPNGGTVHTDVDTWSCDDNAVPINGYEPCSLWGVPATKAIYRQFYLKEPALVRIDVPYYWYCANRAYGYKTLFYGRATTDFSTLSPVGSGWSCFNGAAGSTAGCNLLPAGWYTVVSYNKGPSYDSTMRGTNFENRYNSAVSYYDEFTVTITPTCQGPAFNRPYKASVAAGNQPHLVQIVNRVNNTAAYPRTDTTYILPAEHFNCTLDTPFSAHPIVSCEAAANRVAYYVFKTTQECFLQINAGGYYAVLYDKDVRTDSLQFATLSPIQACNNAPGYIQFCYFQPGTYTLVIFAKDNNVCGSVSPSIYIDKIGYSRFDYAANAYDFGVVPPDSAWHYGKTGDVNPLNSLRAPSNDLFYCTTGSSDSDPTNPNCGTINVNPNVYDIGPNRPLYDSVFSTSRGVSRRNLWYTFVIAQPGYVSVKVESKTPGREYQQRFSVYQSNVDGTLPFSTVVSSGQVDSTTALGLTHIATNPLNWYYCANLNNSIQFYRDPCTSVPTRYYVLVENVNGEPYENGGVLPNTQTEVSILIDSINLVLPKHDHYSFAGDIGTVGVGTYQGDVDNFSCATKDATDPFYYYGNDGRCHKTLWYKFNPTITGNVRYRIYVNGTRYQDYWQVQLFRQMAPNDSTVTGLQFQGYHGVYGSDNTYWAETCVSPGTYYLMITGCDQVNQYVYPEIQLVEAVGDFCDRAVPAALTGPGSVTSTVLVDCHTIGTDYGEFGPQLTCPQGANTIDYKSSWFRMDISGTDTLDVTAYLVENTNAASSDIKYRLMTGNCGAMQEQSCVLDALTQNTYQCLVPGQSYYVQVFTPVSKFNQQVTGTIDLKLSAIVHADTCAPLTNCLATANFSTVFDCNTDESVKFVNFSTYGTSITYHWNFGYNNQTSSEVSPLFFYPPLPYDSTYTVKLLVENTSCGKKDSVIKTVTVPGRPFIDFGADISRCDGAPVTLTATSFTGATYVWQDGSTADTFHVTAAGNNQYWVKVNYNGCSNADTVKVVISNITPRPLQQIMLCSDSVSISASRGQGETYSWSTGATSSSIFVSNPGTYWVDIKYFTCVYRDSFIVNNVNTAKPLGNDTTVCIGAGGYTLNAAISGAVSYVWNDGSTADTLKVMNPGTYNVAINFGSCTIMDTVDIGGFPAATILRIDTSTCSGSSMQLSWGAVVTAAGVYTDTLRYNGGCDSLIEIVTVTVNPMPDLGNDTTVCLAQNPLVLDGTTAGAGGYTWQDGSTQAVYNVMNPGTYWVRADFGNCVSVDSIVVSGSAAPVVIIMDTSICEGLTFTLPWGPVVSSAGSYSDTIHSYLGCDSLIRKVNLQLLSTPNAGNDTSLAICAGQAVNLLQVYNNAGVITEWTFGGVPVTDPSMVYTTGNYLLTVTGNNGCKDSATLTLSGIPKPALGNDTVIAICAGATFDLSGVYNTNSLVSNWTFNALPVTTVTAVSVNGNYQLIALNSGGCTDTAMVNLTVNPKPTLGNDTAIVICPGAMLDLTTVYSTSGLTASWSLGTAVVNNPAAVSAGGIYRLIVSNIAGCMDTAFVTLSYHAVPVLGNDTVMGICGGTYIDLGTIYQTGSATSIWYMGGSPVTNTAMISAAGIYTLIATNNNGCSDTAALTLQVNPKPILGSDTTIYRCAGTDFNLTTLYNTSGFTSDWTINSVAVNNPTAIVTAGNYQLIISSASGCTDTAIVSFVVLAKPAIGNDTGITICQGAIIDLTGLYLTTNLSTTWTFGGSAVADPVHAGAAGNYQLEAINSFGCADTAIVTLTVNPKPQLGNDKVINICQGSVLDLPALYNTGSNSNGWSIAGSPVPNPSAVNTAGIYQLISSNGFSCTDTALVTLTISANPVVAVTNPDTICIGFTTDLTAGTITAGSSAGLVYSYWQDAATTGSLSNASSVGEGVYYIKGVDNAGCFNVQPVVVSSYPLPVVDAGDDVGICDKDSVTTLHVAVSNTSAPVSYLWQPVLEGGIQNPASASSIVTPVSTPLNYIVTVTDGYGCNYAVSDTVTVTRQPPVPAFAGNDTIAPAGVPHQLFASGGVNYIWSPDNLLNNAYIANPLATMYADSTLFSVIAIDEKGCRGYDSVWVKAFSGITYYVPNAFSPNGDGFNDVFRPLPVGIVSTEYFRIFNRYGELMFETHEYRKGWDGTYKGIPQAAANYVWVLKGIGRNGRVIEMKGNVVLVR